MRTIVEEIECKSILNKTPLRFVDYTLNPYIGCAFGCAFCYVPALRQKRGQDGVAEWGQYVQVKVNAADRLEIEIRKASPTARMLMGSATDPWQPVEKRYRLTRRICEIMADRPNHFSVITRSPLIIRDVDVLARARDFSVNFSIGTFDEKVRRAFEPHAPSAAGRIAAIRALQDAGIEPTVFWAPMLPGVSDNREAIEAYFANLQRLGVRRVMCGGLNHRDVVGQNIGRITGGLVRLNVCDGRRIPRIRLQDILADVGARYGVTVV